MNKYLTRTDLYERGWSTSLIRRHMPEPDRLSRGESGKQAHRPSYLYLLARVDAVERTPAFQRDLERSRVLSGRALALAREKKDHLFQVVESAIFFPLDMSFDEALTQAQEESEGSFADMRGLALDILCARLRSDECATIESFGWHAGIKEARIRYTERKLHHIASLYPGLQGDVEDKLRGAV